MLSKIAKDDTRERKKHNAIKIAKDDTRERKKHKQENTRHRSLKRKRKSMPCAHHTKQSCKRRRIDRSSFGQMWTKSEHSFLISSSEATVNSTIQCFAGYSWKFVGLTEC